MAGMKVDRRGREEGIRPAVWLFALISVGACALTLYLVAGASEIDEGPEVVAEDTDQGDDPYWTEHRRSRFESDLEREREYDPNLDPLLNAEYASPDGPDPQMDAMERWLGPQDGGVPMHFNPTYHRGAIADIEGLALEPGTQCDVRVLPVQTYRFSCLIRVMCDGLVLYPDPDQGAGYVECDIEDGQPVAAMDDGFTFADGDPTVSFDRRHMRVTISDEGPGVPHFRAEIDLVGPRRL